MVDSSLTYFYCLISHSRKRSTQQVQGHHYFLNFAEDSNKVYMTADDGSVKCHDYILLNDEVGSTRYQVEIIEYYGDSPTLWTALLVRC